MKKLIFNIGPLEIEKYKYIKTQNDVLLFYINIARLFYAAEPDKHINNKTYAEILIDNYSRVFLKMSENKICSFNFPFSLIDDVLYIGDIKYDQYMLTILERLIKDTEEKKLPFFNVVFEGNYEYEFPEYDIDQIIKAYSYLCKFDCGYFRVEHDVNNENGDYHPTDHIDFYFSQKNTLKLGFSNRPNDQMIKEICDNSKKRKFIKI